MRIVHFLFVLLICLPYQLIGQVKRCSTDEYLQIRLLENPSLKEKIEQLNQLYQEFRQGVLTERRSPPAIITIPVVVHVVHKTAVQNISDQQIISQIEVLNQDFRRQNADAVNTRSIFLGVAADTEIQFCLATVDPNGSSTTGITRTLTTVNRFNLDNAVKRTVDGGIDPWPREDYLNLYVCNLHPSVLGYASFPGDLPEDEGVVIHHQYFGNTGTVVSPFNKGRTTTHEVGHWLGLFHTWGDGLADGCLVDDLMDDTPLSEHEHYNCPQNSPNTCIEPVDDLPDMFENYMEYVNDNCMNVFTQDQKFKMQTVMISFRLALQSSTACQPIGIDDPKEFSRHLELFPVPTMETLNITWNLADFDNWTGRILDINGAIIQQFNLIPKMELDISGLPSGMYFVALENGSDWAFRKFSILK